MNLKLTDAVFDPESGNDNTCFLHLDLGPDYADHHSFSPGASTDRKPAHIHHASFEINDFDTQALGHNWLERKGWKNCLRIGRHVLGSQIFDYWFDASGNILEHYSDGDLVNEDTEVLRNPECPESLFFWGPNIPLAFITGNVKDVIDPPTPPVLAAA
ncbi:hypothetical protein N7488_001840 [Penicillium malachiteum]|nr:hypothetical protein N7488_001840 [Penicillium malachiteum]